VKLGVTVRVMGPQATAETVLACALAAEQAGLDDLWVADHIAIPPEDSEGSEGRYLDPLATLAFLAAATSRIGLGTSVLILPYRPALPTAKWVATIQELSGGRLQLGVGIGWMAPEFRALGVDRRRRGAIADATLACLRDCFASDEVELHGQRFLFRPRPPRPPILVGGAPPHALHRALRYGDGWMPMARDPEQIAAACARLRALAEEAGRPPPEVVPLAPLPLDDLRRARERALGFAALGATRVICGLRYRDAAEFHDAAAALGERRSTLAS
jgi:probable F420-dependent oxidoreductase